MRRLLRIGLLLVLTAGVVATAAQTVRETSSSGVVNFTFDDVDVRTFVKLVGELTGKRFVVGKGIDGKITVVSPRVDQDEIYPLFLSILESVGCSVIEDDGILRVVPLAARPIPVAPVVGSDATTPATGVITKVIRLKHVAAFELQNLLQAKVGQATMGRVGAIGETNHLIVTDTAANVRRIEQLVKHIDQPGLMRVTEVVPLTFADAVDMAAQLNQALEAKASRAEALRRRLAGGGSSGQRTDGQTGAVVAAPHSNSLIVMGTDAQVRSLRDLIKKMDVDVPSGRGRLNAIFLRHLSAEEAAENIGALLAKRQGEKPGGGRGNPIAIQANPTSNALLVDASPGDFEVVKRLIDQLDMSPEQVHIGVVILEVSKTDGFRLGVDFAAVDLPGSVGDSVVQGGVSLGDDPGSLLNAVQSGIFPRGLNVGVAHGTSRDANGAIQPGYPGIVNLDVLRENGSVKIVSETSLQSQNNKEATVSVVNEIPILKSEIQGGSGTSRDVIQNIERMDVGIQLKITPHVIPGDMRRVRMALNPSIEAVIDSGPEGTQFAPTIARRQVETTVTVDDGRTIIIAGLTRKDELENVKKVPLLGDLPLIGFMFRRTEMTTERKDVLIFVTPTIVSDVAPADAVRKAWEEKTGLELDVK